MDGGPYRTPRPNQGRVVSRPGTTQQKPEKAHSSSAGSDSKPFQGDFSSPDNYVSQNKSFMQRAKLPLIVGITVVIVVFIGLFVGAKLKSSNTAIDTSKYQAIFFTNGQVYFGKLEPFNSEYMKLKEVYYLQTQTGSDANSDEIQKTATDQNNVQLIKLGDEIHGPQDEMIVSKNQLLFYENLKSDGKVAQSIEQYKKTKQ